MIDDSIEIEPGMIVRHDPEGGLLYRVDRVSPDTDDYEATHVLNGLRRVAYTQLEDGGYPAGSPWDKSEDQFRAHFTVEESLGNEVSDPATT